MTQICKACGRKRKKLLLSPIAHQHRYSFIWLCREGYISIYGCDPINWEKVRSSYRKKEKL